MKYLKPTNLRSGLNYQLTHAIGPFVPGEKFKLTTLANGTATMACLVTPNRHHYLSATTLSYRCKLARPKT